MVSINDFQRIKRDINGNSRYIIHMSKIPYQKPFLSVKDKYKKVGLICKAFGGKRYNTKRYPFYIVFQSTNIIEIVNLLNQLEVINKSNPTISIEKVGIKEKIKKLLNL